jgi:DNA repair exonuclease SbcCD nuclease subunit
MPTDAVSIQRARARGTRVSGRDQRGLTPMTVRFIHTSDWQLGMTRHFLSSEAQARFTQARIDAIRTIGTVAREEGASFVVVAGDVFESNQLEPRTVRRTIEALRDVPVPVFLLPGNHDPLDASTIYRSATFVEHKPDHVIVLDDSSPRQVAPGVEVVGAPWPSKRVVKDLVQTATAELATVDSTARVLVAHGVPRDPLAGENPAAIDLDLAEAAIADRRIAYLALGDRHSTTSLGSSGAIWYSGAPEPTAYDETDPGNVLVVELHDGRVSKVAPRRVGAWTFLQESFELDSDTGVEPLANWLDACVAKDRCAVRLNLYGTISLSTDAQLQELLDRHRDVFGALEVIGSADALVVRPDDDDFADLQLTGFIDRAVDELREVATRTGPDQQKARDALGLLIRLLHSTGGPA